jgi:hypothetical protein
MPRLGRTLISFGIVGIVVVATVVLLAFVDLASHETVMVVGVGGLAVAVLNATWIKTRNGDTLGGLVDSISDRLFRAETQLDNVEIKLDEHLGETKPLVEFVRRLMGDEEERQEKGEE